MTFEELVYPLAMKWEALRLRPYLDVGGIPTIGYGTTRYPNGVKVTMADKQIVFADAVAFFHFSMQRVNTSMMKLITYKLTVFEQAACADLVYNIGVGVHDGIKGDFADSTLLHRLNAGDISGAANQFAVWNKATVDGKKVAVQGLSNRRAADRDMFLRVS